MRTLFLAALAVSASVSIVTADDRMVTLKPEQVGQIFCLSHTGNDEGILKGIISDPLAEAIDAAWERNSAWEAANPGDKPPLGDGIPWESWPDYAAECTIGLVTLMKTDAKVEVQYHFPDEPDADYTDVLLLKRMGTEDTGLFWRIDDVSFATGGTLRGVLVGAFDES